MEKLARTLFLWKIEVHDQKERVYEMRRWNEALVTNMLPEHVARHFLGSKKRDEVRAWSGGWSHEAFIFMCSSSRKPLWAQVFSWWFGAQVELNLTSNNINTKEFPKASYKGH